MSGTPYFTVLIDNYNHEAELGAAIQSALDQDLAASDFEVLVVDDGSTDGSRKVISSFKDKVRALYQNNQGQTRALNNGFAEARGQIVALLDADDFSLPERLTVMAECFDEPGVVAAQHYMGKIDKNAHVLPSGQPSWPDYFTIEHFQDHQFHFGATSGMSYRKSYLDRIRPTPPFDHYYLDCFLISNSLLYGSVRCVRKELSFWRAYASHTCLAPFSQPKSQEWEWRMRRLFVDEMGRQLSAKGLAFSQSFLDREKQEMLRRELLFHAYRGERREALSALLKATKSAGPAGFTMFRAATLSLALFSPHLYASLYDLYYQHPEWGAWRQRLLPGRS